MMKFRTVAACALAMTIAGETVDAQDLSRYRTFEFGASVAAVATLTGVASSVATTIHQRPALLQNLEWRPSRWTAGSTAESTDPVERIGFSFYDDRYATRSSIPRYVGFSLIRRAISASGRRSANRG